MRFLGHFPSTDSVRNFTMGPLNVKRLYSVNGSPIYWITREILTVRAATTYLCNIYGYTSSMPKYTMVPFDPPDEGHAPDESGRCFIIDVTRTLTMDRGTYRSRRCIFERIPFCCKRTPFAFFFCIIFRRGLLHIAIAALLMHGINSVLLHCKVAL